MNPAEFAALARKKFPNDKMRQERFIQRYTVRMTEFVRGFDEMRKVFMGGIISPMECVEGTPKFFDFTPPVIRYDGGKVEDRDTAADATKRLANIKTSYEDAMKRKQWNGAAGEILKYKPLTLPTKSASRVPPPKDPRANTLYEGWRAMDFSAVLLLQKAYQARFCDLAGRASGLGGEDDDLFASGGAAGGRGAATAAAAAAAAAAASAADTSGEGVILEAAASAYKMLERVLREFMPSLFAGQAADGVAVPNWPWDAPSVEVCIPRRVGGGGGWGGGGG